MKSYIAGEVIIAICVAVVCFGIGCGKSARRVEKVEPPVVMTFSLMLDDAVYTRTNYKKPPQFAIWLENTETATIRTVWVTRTAGKGGWGGATRRPIALPVWVSQWNIETRTMGEPTPDNPAVDAVTGATPRGSFTVEVEIPGGGTWDYYVEVNVSGDYNETFAAQTNEGRKDANGNGQPSIVYNGTIEAKAGQSSTPKLIGRTDQFEAVTLPIEDMEGITTAAKLMSGIEVSCRSSSVR